MTTLALLSGQHQTALTWRDGLTPGGAGRTVERGSRQTATLIIFPLIIISTPPRQTAAIRRCGELLKQVAAGVNRHDSRHDGTDIARNRTQAAKDAGLSERQKVTALRVANGEKSSRLAP